MKGVRAQLQEKTQALETETSRAARAEEKLSISNAELETVREELKKWEGSAEGLKAVGARAAGELSELKASEADLKRKLADSQQALETAWSDLAALRKDSAMKVAEAVEAVRVEAAEAREKWKRHSQQKAVEWSDLEKSLRENLQALRAEMTRKEESYEWRIHALTEKERELKFRLEQKENALAEERVLRAQAQAPFVEECRKLREAERAAEERILQQRAELRGIIEALENEKRELRAATEAITSERDKWKDECASISQRVARLEAKHAEATANLELEKVREREREDTGTKIGRLTCRFFNLGPRG